MNSHTGPLEHHEPRHLDTVILALGVLAAVSAVLTAMLSFADLLDPPQWVRIAMTSGIPVGVFGIPIAWVIAADDERRAPATKIGLALVALVIVAFVVMVNVAY